MQPVPTLASALITTGFFRRAIGRKSLRGGLLVIPLALVACRDPKITTYSVPKEALAELPATAPVHAETASTGAQPQMPKDSAHTGVGAAPAAADMAGGPAVQTAVGDGLTWTVPANWQTKVGSAMRKATYSVTGSAGASAELAISAFPGDVGGEVANVLRWRGQVGLGAIGDAEAAAAIFRLDVNGLKVGVVDVADPSSNAIRLLGAMVPYGGATWFFKLMGPDAVVGEAKPAFLEFLKTLKPSGGTKP
jgi:hypothetical protein